MNSICRFLIAGTLLTAFTGCVNANPPAAAPDFTRAAENTINGVVSIKSYATSRGQMQGGGNPFSDPMFEYFFGGGGQRRYPQQERREQELGLGSGVILSDNGYIVTNNHVIAKAERLEVTLNDNRTFDATVIGADPVTDLALLKIDSSGLPVIPMGNSDDLKVGQWVLAVGNPFGFTSTVTAGIVSAKARNISASVHSRASMGIESYIQTDAAVNPGNSGGALVNTSGELIGINTAIYSQTGNYAGYSFAIPASIVTKVVEDLKQYGTVQRAVLGITFRELTPALVKEKNITSTTSGILVEEVIERSAAREAELQAGDIIVEIEGNAVGTTAQLQEQMARFRPGDKISITYLRGSERKKTGATLRNSQGSVSLTKAGDFSELGCALQALGREQLRRLQLNYGVQVTGLAEDGKFARAGIKQGFIILEINGTRVRSVSDIEKMYDSISHSSTADDKVMFISGLYPTGRKFYYAVDLSGE